MIMVNGKQVPAAALVSQNNGQNKQRQAML
jgi:hypothetical protein